MAQRISSLVLTACLAGSATLLAACQRHTAADYLADAKQQYQKGDRKAAQIQAKNALAAEPGNAEARLLLARASYETGELLAAEKEVRRAMELGYQPDESLALLVKILMARHEYRQVLSVTEARKGEPAVQAMRGAALLAQRKLADAKAEYEAVLQADPDNADALSGLARHAALSHDVAEAVRLNDLALAKDAHNTSALGFRAELLRFQNQPEEARKVYQELLAQDPGNRDVLLQQVAMDLSIGKLDAAEAGLKKALASGPRTVAITYTQALLYMLRKDGKSAREAVLEALRVAPRHMPSLLLAGTLQLEAGNVAQAEQYLRTFVEANPQHRLARQLLAASQLRARQPEQALAVLGPLLAPDRVDANTLAMAGEAMGMQREFGKMAGYLEQAVALSPKDARLRTALGEARLQMGERATAISELERATALAPESLHAAFSLARARFSLGEYDKALAALQPLDAAHGKNPILHNMRGLVHLARHDDANARASYEKAIALDPKSFDPVFNLSRLDMRKRELDAAQRRLEAYLKQVPQEGLAMQALAQLAEDQGQWETARSWLQKAAAARPDDLMLALRLARFDLAHGKPQDAVTALRKLHTNHAEHPLLLDLLSEAEAATGQLPQAVEAASKLAALVPRAALPQYRIGQLEIRRKDWNAAQRALQKALALEPNYVPAHLALVELAVRRNEPAAAFAAAKQLQQQLPKRAEGYTVEGDLLVAQDKWAKAIVLFEKSLALKSDPYVMLKLLGAERRLGMDAAADARAAKWRQQFPRDPVLQQYAAERAMVRRDYGAARQEWESLLKQYPANPLAWNNLAVARQKLKDKDALKAAERALAMWPDQPAFLDTAGTILVDQGDLKRGIAMLKQASALQPEAADIRYHLAQALLRQGEKMAARKELQLALANGNNFAESDSARALLKNLE
jgi:putative PEP-CTERM system TPR-repeat lipoprotein